MDDVISTKEAGKMLGVSEKTITKYCSDGLLSFYRIGRGRYNIRKDSVISLINGSKKEATFKNSNNEKE